MRETDVVLSYLEDEKSKFIYQKRVENNETGNYECIEDIAKRSLEMRQGVEYYTKPENEMVELLGGARKRLLFLGMVA